ncbi:probable G-protein coupled receptor 139 [Heptranchias perlo]|uniref:probable G-protein coupled receptor 139 n=1 Tax=Heptranchias perlo TaxID=212740 RepID=UPI00355AA087
MAAADLLVVITDLILRQIPILYYFKFHFLFDIPVCNIHAALLYAATDCSVWFTVAFTFDRFVAICCQKLKTKYCTERTAAVVIGIVTVLFSLKNIFWYFMFTSRYILQKVPWFCVITISVMLSPVWTAIEFLHYILTPCVPFILILMLNALTVRHILVTIRIRKRLRVQSSGESDSDPETKNRRKSITLLLVISGNFILLWALLVVCTMYSRIVILNMLDNDQMLLIIQELGFMLQLLSCCTNTSIYGVTQSKFREELKNGLKYPFTLISKIIK